MNKSLSTVKMTRSELKNYTAKLQKVLETPGPAQIRVCECCIQVSEA